MAEITSSLASSVPRPTGRRAARLSCLVFCLLLALFATTRVLFADQFSLGGGELFALSAARMPWAGLFSLAAADIVHPPLFYILLKIWIALGGDSLLWVKMLAVLSGAAIVIPFVFIGQALRLRPAARNLALLLLASNGYLIHYAQEVRMYGLFASLVLVSLWLFLRWWETSAALNSQLFALSATNLFLIYTHYYGWLVIGLELAFLTLWRRAKLIGFAVSICLLAVCFSPWAYIVAKEASRIGGLSQNLDWIPRPGLARLASLYLDFSGTSGLTLADALGLVVFGYPLLSMARASFAPGWLTMRIRTGRRLDPAAIFWMLLLVAFLPSLSLFVISQRSALAVWIDRYFVFAAAPYMLVVAAAIQQLRPRTVRRIVVIGVVVWSLWAGLHDIVTNRMAWQGAQVGSRVHWATIAGQLSLTEASQNEDVNIYTLPVYSEGLLTGDWVISTSMRFYLAAIPDERFRFVYARDASTLLAQADTPHFWIAFFDLGHNQPVFLERALRQDGYRLGEAIMDGQGSNRLVLLPVWRD